ncbi:PLAC8 motif-containing protein [Parasponia andersonii]|uniref:PLAC8 motif-containing protein n=1 Tax=Parasponia andersonii TaxID=3476 RepID=A0A2P5D7H9_PARAD|nr:PLAC8 motif-containing protein [Parasponia andersonii]
MATNGNDNNNGVDESSPFLSKQVEGAEEKSNNAGKPTKASPEEALSAKSPAPGHVKCGGACGWTADGLPLGHGSVVGEPIQRTQWDSSLFACLGRNDEFCSSDLEVCLLGSVAPCVLYGTNVERLGSSPGTFANHCLPYSGLYLLGNFFFGGNFLAPWFSYPSRSAIRRKFNLEAKGAFSDLPSLLLIFGDEQGSCEALHRSFGCCGSFVEDEVQREQCETACDFATHIFCHPCALCQEGRELRRQLPHPGFNAQPVMVMIPPTEQTMGRGA